MTFEESLICYIMFYKALILACYDLCKRFEVKCFYAMIFVTLKLVFDQCMPRFLTLNVSIICAMISHVQF